ncbi:MAG: aminotransferase class III-fold pyridoxal phosphate-dependent enzyme [Microcystis aeruginosa Ma_MB_F_20061100_S19]|uniref:Taurine--pyruvate aminotransferase n=1 Tax=Microcystis aeruginosa SPC777 TaxID=482300 RepID=S3JSC1_MICAE|nr:aminotransferase class III-fold pyridoxal phosphate-dependent enzyme [Microcystis aeruginosa]EPF22827.1 Taurine--pyruvate aminotransferase [Microcystis aeruginosa SPC777]NCR97030.1 aminotransferase class III-fold pyridoxal phosphate-dependent enzyme [Microcystis aeruginosa L311-01]TRU05650.1 MAG: aminotransferase class III-fold pyridoxal phosphate-dependent enzyme [Microcystis aeruginosa Ma_MB_F_20061100_S19D]TRU16039.1 MAG: aminotransferase class III-fold pyridoxal phosphate-dependent enzym
MKPEQSHVFNTTRWHNTCLMAESGKGIYVYDSEGKTYLDAIGGTHVISIGHGVTEVADAMAEQARQLCFIHKAQFTSEPQEKLANVVTTMAPEGMDRVGFVTSGSTANEMAFQIALYYHKLRGKASKYKIISRWHSYHGHTIATLAMTGSRFVRESLSPFDLLNFPHIQAPHCYQCPYKLTYPSCELTCANELARIIEQEGVDTIAAFIAEPIIGGAGSAIVPPPGYYEKVREICDFYDILWISEEVITGFGRTGKNFGVDHWAAIPDIITATKALSSGYAPIGAVIVHQRVREVFDNATKNIPLSLFTYAGHPISCAAALAVQNYMAKHNLIERCAVMGKYLKHQLEKLAEREPIIGDVRGEGLLIGIEFVKNRDNHQPFSRSLGITEKIMQLGLENGLILRGRFGTGVGVDGDHILISPPFTITESQCDELVEKLELTFKQVKQSLKLVEVC